MGKINPKQGQSGASMPPLSQKELCQRVHFAVQASTYLHSLGSTAGSSDRKGKRKFMQSSSSENGLETPMGSGSGRSRNVDYEVLAKSNMKATKKMAAHTQLKLDPSLKRDMCRGCGTYLILGLTSRIRNRPNKRTIHTTNTSCLYCSTHLSIPAPPVDSNGLELDGPVRRRRREATLKRSKLAFHERERKAIDEKGHHMWINDEKVVGWGERVAESTETA